MEDKRQHKRIDKNINMQYCLADIYPKKWDVSIIKNISVGGIKFIAPNDLNLKDKIIHLRIKIPELWPNLVDLEALVIDIRPHLQRSQYSEVRAKFINLSDSSKEQLSVVERMIDRQEKRTARGMK
jgi:hypothetical protein